MFNAECVFSGYAGDTYEGSMFAMFESDDKQHWLVFKNGQNSFCELHRYTVDDWFARRLCTRTRLFVDKMEARTYLLEDFTHQYGELHCYRNQLGVDVKCESLCGGRDECECVDTCVHFAYWDTIPTINDD